jgi:hypothetical protein
MTSLRRHPHHSPIPPAFCALLLLLAACDPAGPEPQHDSGQQDTATVTPARGVLDDMNMEIYATADPHVPKSELECVVNDFNAHIHKGDTQQHTQILPRQAPLVVAVGELQAAVDALSCGNGHALTHGVMVHYGLDAEDRFDVMLQVLCLDHDEATKEFSYEHAEDGFTLDGSGNMVYDTDAHAYWYASSGPGARYASKVVIRHATGGQWAQYNDSIDVRSTIYPFQVQLNHLIAHNGLGSESLLRITPIAEPKERRSDGAGGYIENGFHQACAWVPEGIDLDDTAYASTPYLRKAADLGAPCPFHCPGTPFTFKTSGLPARSGC